MATFDGSSASDTAPAAGAASVGSFDSGSDLAAMELPTQPTVSGLEDRIRRYPLASVLVALIIGIIIRKAWD